MSVKKWERKCYFIGAQLVGIALIDQRAIGQELN